MYTSRFSSETIKKSWMIMSSQDVLFVSFDKMFVHVGSYFNWNVSWVFQLCVLSGRMRLVHTFANWNDVRASAYVCSCNRHTVEKVKQIINDEQIILKDKSESGHRCCMLALSAVACIWALTFPIAAFSTCFSHAG